MIFVKYIHLVVFTVNKTTDHAHNSNTASTLKQSVLCSKYPENQVVKHA